MIWPKWIPLCQHSSIYHPTMSLMTGSHSSKRWWPDLVQHSTNSKDFWESSYNCASLQTGRARISGNCSKVTRSTSSGSVSEQLYSSRYTWCNYQLLSGNPTCANGTSRGSYTCHYESSSYVRGHETPFVSNEGATSDWETKPLKSLHERTI